MVSDQIVATVTSQQGTTRHRMKSGNAAWTDHQSITLTPRASLAVPVDLNMHAFSGLWEEIGVDMQTPHRKDLSATLELKPGPSLL